MRLHELKKVTDKSKKRIGRGLGSGKGKTGGRGTKGQKARGRVSLGFIGGTLPFYKKLPFRRGIGNPKRSPKILLLQLSKLTIFKSGSTVDLTSLIDAGLINKKEAEKFGVKIVGNGDLDKSLNVKVLTTAPAAAKIKAAGGTIISA
ncbi:MAG: 50S ribosomal protein L15 [Armatimonadetes bacterium]|nr:MAG: 50S ribosomal protein L15 [Armatimonadota bacterium]